MNGPGNILVLNGEDIGSPETLAMLQAFYSRSPMSIHARLKSLSGDETGIKEEKIKAALKRYYVDYGHASIADCGDAVVFIEGVSMLAAKVLQDDPLYNGQECSTRYLDFSTQPFLTATGTDEEHEIVEAYRGHYTYYLPLLKAWARENYLPGDVVSAKVAPEKVTETWEKTCDAIAFDIARSLLPCGASTSLAWKGSLRRLRERCTEMSYHPLEEVREVAQQVHDALLARHPNSFKPGFLNPNGAPRDTKHYYNRRIHPLDFGEGPNLIASWMPDVHDDIDIVYEEKDYLRAESDHSIYFHVGGNIDFGSARDLLRHRPGLNRVPMVGDPNQPVQFSEWYAKVLRELDPNRFAEIEASMKHVVNKVELSAKNKQYLYPMGTLVAVKLIWNLGQMRYVIPLRTKTSVHPTLREWMWKLHAQVIGRYPAAGNVLTIDGLPHYMASDRGNQTIKERLDASNSAT